MTTTGRRTQLLRVAGLVLLVHGFVFAGVAGLVQSTQAAEANMSSAPGVAVDFESLLDTRFFPSGIVGLGAGAYNLVFAPQTPVVASATVLDARGGIIGALDFLPDYQFTSQVFGRLLPDGAGEVALPGPGRYEIRFSVNDAAAGSLWFDAARPAGADPFAPEQPMHYTGPWSRWGYLIGSDFRDGGNTVQAVNLVWWPGISDLSPGATRAEPARMVLFRNGAVIAHSKRNTLSIHPEHHRRERPWMLFRPHEDKDANTARAFPFAELVDANGDYEIRVERIGDGATVRRFGFTVRGGAIVPHPRSVVGHVAAEALIAPRVTRKGSNLYEFTEVTWVEARD